MRLATSASASKESGIDAALEQEIARIRGKIAKRMHDVEELGNSSLLSGNASGFIGFKERSFHEDEVILIVLIGSLNLLCLNLLVIF
jgi:hypothetical protein